MKFNAKRDRFFSIIMVLTLFIIAVASLWSVVYDVFYVAKTEWAAVWIMIALFFVASGFIIWIWLDIEYVFHDDFLFVRGGPFRSRIPYSQITRINETNQVFAGYRILSSRDALEIHYRTGILGSIIISPERKKEFINELKKRCPRL